VWSHLFIVDITRSMNTEDYQLHGRPVSRLEYLRHTLLSTLARLPCGSHAGIGVFTERNGSILVMPVEICENFGAIEQTVRLLDWRTAWAGDSNIGRGLYNTLKLVLDARTRGLLPAHTSLVFLTDGHEAPPVNPHYEPDFGDLGPVAAAGGAAEVVPGALQLAAQHGRAAAEQPGFEGEKGVVPGLVVGVGGRNLSPIPRLREDGTQEGFYEEDDVQQATRFGDPTPEQRATIEGFEARNAPWGREAATGNEHYSSVREEHLRALAEASGLHYHYLDHAAGLPAALARAEWALPMQTTVPLRGHFLLAALILLTAALVAAVASSVRLPRRLSFARDLRRRSPAEQPISFPI
jgi:mxaL protein